MLGTAPISCFCAHQNSRLHRVSTEQTGGVRGSKRMRQDSIETMHEAIFLAKGVGNRLSLDGVEAYLAAPLIAKDNPTTTGVLLVARPKVNEDREWRASTSLSLWEPEVAVELAHPQSSERVQAAEAAGQGSHPGSGTLDLPPDFGWEENRPLLP